MQDQLKTCPKCKSDKVLEDFHRSKTGKFGRQCWCKVCINEKNRANKINNKEYFQKWSKDHYNPSDNPQRYAKHRDKYLERRKIYAESIVGRVKTLFHSAKSRAIKRNLEFSISREWIVEQYKRQNGTCLLTGIEFDLKCNGSRSYKPFSPSLDRIEPSKGYTEENTRLVCTAMNIALNHFGESIFEKVATGFLMKRNGNLP